MSGWDAVVVGSGPNGLAAAVTLAQAGVKVVVFEARDTVGGGARTQELTLPGFLHDVCSAIHPLGLSSPFFRRLPLDRHGLEWIQPDVPVAHALDGGRAAALYQDVDQTAAALGQDEGRYRAVFGTLTRDWPRLDQTLLGPFSLPRHPLAMIGFGLQALWPAALYARTLFQTPEARALFAGLAGHSVLPLERPASAAVGLVLGTLGHAVGWPLPRGGSQRLSEALRACLESLGGAVLTGRPIRSLDELPPARATLLDLTPRGAMALAGDRFPPAYQRRLRRFRHGPGVFKLDLALDGPIPWEAEACRRAGTVHVGGTLEEVAEAERACWEGYVHPRPFVLVAQQSLFDPTRAPAGHHTAWAYCHVPYASREDATEAIEAQIERFAPGFRARILARHVLSPAGMEAYNPNYHGGDITGGVQDLTQIWTRPIAARVPYATPVPGLYLCSSSTPPGGGVHGMCGYHAAQAALRERF